MYWNINSLITLDYGLPEYSQIPEKQAPVHEAVLFLLG